MKRRCAKIAAWLTAVGTVLYPVAVVGAPAIQVTPLGHSFGDTALGQSSSQIVSVANVGSDPLTITALFWLWGSSSAFTIEPPPVPPTVLAPGASVDYEVFFTPTVVGYVYADLLVFNNDPQYTLVIVSVDGNGVEPAATPAEQAAQLVSFVDESVADGTLTGAGSGKSGANRLHAFQAMIETAAELVADGDTQAACEQLRDALRKADGDSKPPDFVTGPAAAEVAEQIQTLMEDLGC